MVALRARVVAASKWAPQNEHCFCTGELPSLLPHQSLPWRLCTLPCCFQARQPGY